MDSSEDKQSQQAGEPQSQPKEAQDQSQPEEQEDEAKPEWDVATHGPVPEGQEDQYEVTDSTESGQETTNEKKEADAGGS